MPKKYALLALGLVFSGFFLWLAIRDAELIALLEAIRGSRYAYGVPLLLFLWLYFYLKALRWSLLLEPLRHFRARQLVPATVIGYMGNVLLPLYLGELVRIEALNREHGVPRTAALGSLAVERLFDFLTILCLIGVLLAFEEHAPSYLQTGARGVAAIFFLGLFVVFGLVLFPQRSLRYVGRMASLFPAKVEAFAVANTERLITGLAALRRPRLVTAVALVSIGHWLTIGACIQCSLFALGLELPWSASFLVLALSVIGMTLPSSPAFIGTIQLAFTLGLSPFGVEANEALAASLFFHVLLSSSIVSAGLIMLHQLGARLSELRVGH